MASFANLIGNAEINVDTSQLKKIAVKFGRAASTYPAFIGSRLKIATEMMKDAISAAAPQSSRQDDGYLNWQKNLGGPLADSYRVQRSGTKFSWAITEGAEYGRFVREGNSPATLIAPRYARMLWWPGLTSPIPWVGTLGGIRMTRDRTAQEPNDFVDDAVQDTFVPVSQILEKEHVGFVFTVFR